TAFNSFPITYSLVSFFPHVAWIPSVLRIDCLPQHLINLLTVKNAEKHTWRQLSTTQRSQPVLPTQRLESKFLSTIRFLVRKGVNNVVKLPVCHIPQFVEVLQEFFSNSCCPRLKLIRKVFDELIESELVVLLYDFPNRSGIQSKHNLVLLYIILLLNLQTSWEWTVLNPDHSLCVRTGRKLQNIFDGDVLRYRLCTRSGTLRIPLRNTGRNINDIQQEQVFDITVIKDN